MGGAFSPLDLSETIVWLDPTQGMDVSGDGSSIGSWADRTGYVTVTQGTASKKPTLKLNIKNGKPILRFDGTDFLQSSFTALSQPFLVFIVAQLDSGSVNDGNGNHVLNGDDANNRMQLYTKPPSTPDAWAMYAGSEVIGGDADGSWNIWSALFNGPSSELWLNGVSELSGDVGAQNPDGITVGASYDDNNHWVGDIGDIIICDPSLSTADHNKMLDFLSGRWNISYTPL